MNINWIKPIKFLKEAFKNWFYCGKYSFDDDTYTVFTPLVTD